MRSTVEPLEGNKVKLSIEIDEAEFEPALSAAYQRIAKEVKIPGFRPGKAPRRILEARLGSETARREALREVVPEYFAQALRQTETDAVSAPEIEITAGAEGGPVSFDAVVQVRPTVSIPGYQSLQVTIPSPVVPEEDVDAQIDRLRANDAELVDVSRPAKDGDVLRIDVRATIDGRVADEMSDYSHEIGKVSGFPADVDDHLRGAKVGDILQFDAQSTGRALAFRIFVKQIQEKQLPEATDEWAAEASEFETLEELRDDLRTRLGAVKVAQARAQIPEASAAALAELVAEDVPDVMIQSAAERRLHELNHTLQSQNRDLQSYLQALRLSGEEFVDTLKEGAVQAVKVDLALRALADLEEIEATEEDLTKELEALAPRLDRTVEQLRSELEQAEQMSAVRSDVRKAKALDWLAEHVELVDPDGQPIDRALLEEPDADEEAEGADEAEGASTDDSGAASAAADNDEEQV